MKILILIPTYNENENIEKLLSKIFKIVNSECSVLIIDDNSPDKTSSTVQKLQKKYSQLHLLQREKKNGLAQAYINGFKWGIEKEFDAFITMDADFSHNPDYLNIFVENLKKYDVIIGSRNVKGGRVEGWSLFRNIISKCGSFYSRIALGMFKNPIYDLTGGFNAYTATALSKININSILSKGYLFQIEMKYKAWKNKCSFLEFPIIFENRISGESKMSSKIFVEALFYVWKIKFNTR